MAFEKGQPRPSNSGRRKGSKNKKTLLKVEEILADKGLNPVQEIINAIPLLKPNEQVSAWFDLLKYVEAPLRSREVLLDVPKEEAEVNEELKEESSDALIIRLKSGE